MAVSGTGIAQTNLLPVVGAVLWLDAADPTTMNSSTVGATISHESDPLPQRGTRVSFTTYCGQTGFWVVQALASSQAVPLLALG